MEIMSSRFLSRLGVIATLVVLVASPLALSARQRREYRGRFKPPPPTSNITVTVLRNDTGTPVRNAGVVFQPYIRGRFRGGMELRTNQYGKAVMTVIPIGDTILVQVIARGYQTYGQVYKVEKDKMAINVRVKLPVSQYSTYQEHGSASGAGGKYETNGSYTAQGKSGSSAPTTQDSGSGSKSSSNQKPSENQKSPASPKQ